MTNPRMATFLAMGAAAVMAGAGAAMRPPRKLANGSTLIPAGSDEEITGQDVPFMTSFQATGKTLTPFEMKAKAAASDKRERRRLKRRLDFLNTAIRHAAGGAAVTAMDEERSYVLLALKDNAR